jgi:hypothetical protein
VQHAFISRDGAFAFPGEAYVEVFEGTVAVGDEKRLFFFDDVQLRPLFGLALGGASVYDAVRYDGGVLVRVREEREDRTFLLLFEPRP